MIVGSRLVRAAAEGEDVALTRRRSFAGAPAIDCPRCMGLVLTAVFGFVVWIVLWALGAKALRRLHDHDR